MAHRRSLAAVAEFVDGAAFADAGQHILQNMPAGRVIQHVVGGDGRDAERGGGVGNGAQPDGVVGAMHQRQGDIGPVAEIRFQAAQVFFSGIGAEDADQIF